MAVRRSASSFLLAYIERKLRQSAEVKLRVANEQCALIAEVVSALVETFRAGGKVVFFGNGGSAADAQHLAGELVGRFNFDRPALPAFSLTTETSILTAVANDSGWDGVFARQVEAFVQNTDAVIAISTSGNSPNVLRAVGMAKMRRAKTIGLTGADGGELARLVDIAVQIPSEDTPRIQEAHMAVGHIICEMVEKELFGTGAR